MSDISQWTAIPLVKQTPNRFGGKPDSVAHDAFAKAQQLMQGQERMDDSGTPYMEKKPHLLGLACVMCRFGNIGG